MSKNKIPSGIELTSLAEEFRQNPYPIFDKLRKEVPVFEDKELGRFLISKYDDVKASLRDPDYWSNPQKANEGTFTREFVGRSLSDDGQVSMLLMDEPDHRRLRSLVSQSFTPNAVEKWRDRTREVIHRILNRIEDSEFDLIREFAGPVPTVVIAEMLGIDPDMHDDFKNWSDTAVLSAFNPFPTEEQMAASDEASENLENFFHSEIKSRRNDLGDDLISDMIRAEENGEKLTEDEMVMQANLLLIAGNVTTTDLIGNAMKALLDHSDQWQLLKQDPSLINKAVEEVLRFDSPVINSGRIPNREVEVRGCPVGRGESLIPLLAAANHDADVYSEPEKFNIERKSVPHQSFGGGRHFCLGAHLARLEAQEAILALMERYPDMRHSEKGYVYHAIPGFRGMESFWVETD